MAEMSARRGGPTSHSEVRAAYKEAFGRLRDSASAWNFVLDDLAGPYDPDAATEDALRRDNVANIMSKVAPEVELELGDPFRVAVRDAMRWIRRQGIAEDARRAWRDLVQDVREGRSPTGAKDWSPRRTPPEDEEQLMEGVEGPNVYIGFDDDGTVSFYTIEYPDYFRGHPGPVASVPVHDKLTYDDIEEAVSNGLAEAEIDWGARGEGPDG